LQNDKSNGDQLQELRDFVANLAACWLVRASHERCVLIGRTRGQPRHVTACCLGPTFTAQNIDGEDVTQSSLSGIRIDPQQVDISRRYKSRLEKNVDYRLVIQRSTGRFSEEYTEEAAKMPFSDRTGRCSQMPNTK
jgi:hypothetical protein